jgi:two-component system phosphate regulon sensor histidine kinase PhoR
MPRTRFVWHLFVGWFTLLAAVIVACFWQASVRLAELADDAQLRRSIAVAEAVASKLPERISGDDSGSVETFVADLARTSGMQIDLFDGEARSVLPAGRPASPGAGDEQLLQEAREGRVARSSRYDAATGRRVLAIVMPSGPPGRPKAIIRVTTDSLESDRSLGREQRRMLAGYLAIGLAAAWGGYIVAKRCSQSVETLAGVAGQLAAGAFETTVPAAELAEVAEVAEALEVMRQQLVERGLTIGRQGSQQEAVLGSMVEGVLAVDARQRIVSINRAAAELLGLDPARAVRRPLQEVVRNPDLRRFALRAIDCREPIEDDLLMRGARDRTILVRGTALTDARGADGGAVIVLNDVTHFRQLENIRRDFVANVSHELKTPIASIKGFVETLLDGAVDDPADAERFLGIVARQAERLEAIIEDLLALSRIEQTEGAGNLPVEEAEVRAVIEAAVSDCSPRAAEKSIRIEVACEERLVVPINAPLVEQAIINLVDNAIKYSEPERLVRVSAHHGTADEGGDRPCAVIAVADQGCGIDEEHLPRIFERFYRVDKARSRKEGGTGLGLSIVKHIVQAHGGAVSVDSEPGVGTTFRLFLPLATESAASGTPD